MRFNLSAAAGIAALVLVAAAAPTPVGAQTTPTFVNAKVLSLDAQSRMIKVRLPDGTEQTAELDDNVAGFSDLAVGDSVTIAMRGDPGRSRVSSIVKGGTTSAAVAVAAAPAPPPAAVVVGANLAETAYVGKLTELARRADAVDREWAGFKTACKAESSSSYDGSREWLMLWDNAQAADLSSGFCRDLFNQIVSHGSTISTQMASADSEARRTLSLEKAKELRRAYSLDAANWGTTPPKLLEP